MTDTTPAQAATPEPQAGEGQQTVTEQPNTEQSAATVWTPDSAAAEIKALRAENAKHRKAATEADRLRQEAETASLAEQGKYKDLWEKAQAEAQATAGKLAQMELDQQRRDAAQAAGVPQLWQRLQGSTPEELAEDAEGLATMMKAAQKQPAPSLDAGAGSNGKLGSTVTDEEVKNFATRFNIDPQFVDRAEVAKAYKR